MIEISISYPPQYLSMSFVICDKANIETCIRQAISNHHSNVAEGCRENPTITYKANTNDEKSIAIDFIAQFKAEISSNSRPSNRI